MFGIYKESRVFIICVNYSLSNKNLEDLKNSYYDRSEAKRAIV